MNRILKALAVAAFITVAGNVVAQVVTQDGQRTVPGRTGIGQGMLVGGVDRSDTTFRVITLTAGGNVIMEDAARDRDNIATSQGIVFDTVGTGISVPAAAFAIAQWSAESTAVIPTWEYKNFAIGINAWPAQGDTTMEMTFAIQVRGHSQATYDTSSTFAWTPWPVAAALAGAADADTALGDLDVLGYNGVQGYSSPFSQEFQVKLSPKRGYGHMGYGQAFGTPRGKYIILKARGENWWAPYTSIRIRQLRGKTGARVRLDFMMGS